MQCFQVGGMKVLFRSCICVIYLALNVKVANKPLRNYQVCTIAPEVT